MSRHTVRAVPPTRFGLAVAGGGAATVAAVLLGAAGFGGGGPTAPRADPARTLGPASTWTTVATALGVVSRGGPGRVAAAAEVAGELTPRLCRELVAGTTAPDCAGAVLARFTAARRPYPGVVRLVPLGDGEAFGCAQGHLIRLRRTGAEWLVDAFGHSAACPPSFS